MTGRSHILFGIAAGILIARWSGTPALQSAAIVGMGALGALIPDVDHPRSSIRMRTGIAGDALFFWARHRGITHSLLALLLIALAALRFVPGPIGYGFAAGYASHLAADMVTVQGIPLLMPLTSRRIAIPLLHTGGLVEALIDVLMLGVIGWLIWLTVG